MVEYELLLPVTVSASDVPEGLRRDAARRVVLTWVSEADSGSSFRERRNLGPKARLNGFREQAGPCPVTGPPVMTSAAHRPFGVGLLRLSRLPWPYPAPN